jgi:hypothetical protein
MTRATRAIAVAMKRTMAARGMAMATKKAIVMACSRPSRYVPYKGTFVPYDGTYGAPD